MAGYQNILVEMRDDGIAVITLNNPENRNPLTEATKVELINALNLAADDGDVRTLVLTGKGSAFCAGGDVKNIGKVLPPEEIRAVMGQSQQLLLALLNLKKPVVAAVNGDAFGMGCNLALACDFPIASDNARFCQVFIKLGIMPDFGALYFLPRLVGPVKAKELVYTGKAISAEDAFQMGLIQNVVSPDVLEAEALNFAGKLAKLPTKAIGRAKKVINQSFDLTLNQVLEEEINAQIDLTRTEDHQEGVRALMEKRKPEFKGR